MKTKTLCISVFIALVSLSSMQLFSQAMGDVNSSGAVDIVDALLIAQYYVGLNPASFNIDMADTNCSGTVDIVDALLVAQYYVGLLSAFPGCAGTSTPTINPTVEPTVTATPEGTIEPTAVPTVSPSPTAEPSALPPTEPTAISTPVPSPTSTGPTPIDPSPPMTPPATPTNTPVPTILPAEPTLIAVSDRESRITWGGSNYGFSWNKARLYTSESTGNYYEDTINFSILDTQGTKTGTPVCLNVKTGVQIYSRSNLIWNGSQYAIVWTEGQPYPLASVCSLYFAALDASGTVTKRATLLDNTAISAVEFVWTGAEYVIAWEGADPSVAGISTNLKIGLIQIDSSGNRLQTDVQLNGDYHAANPPDGLLWTGSSLNFFYQGHEAVSGYANLDAITLDLSGTIVSDNIVVANGMSLARSVVWNGSGYTYDIYYYGNSYFDFAIIDESGNRLYSYDWVTTGSYSSCFFSSSINKIGDRYVVPWVAGNDTMKLYVLNSAAQLMVANENIKDTSSKSFYPNLAWTGTEYGIAFWDARNTDPVTGDSYNEIYFVRLDSQFNKIGGDIRLTNINDAP